MKPLSLPDQSIRWRIGFFLICVLIAFAMLDYCVDRLLVMPGFVSLEHDAALKDMEKSLEQK